MTALERINEEQRVDIRSEAKRHASDAVSSAAAWLGLLDDDSDELTQEVQVRIATFLCRDAIKHAGQWPLPEVARLRRALDGLFDEDEDADLLDYQTRVYVQSPPVPMVTHARAERGVHPCGVVEVHGVTRTPPRSGLWRDGRAYSEPPPTCPGCASAAERLAAACAVACAEMRAFGVAF